MSNRQKIFAIQSILGVLTDTQWGPNASSALAQALADAKREDHLTPEQQFALQKSLNDLKSLLENKR